MPLHKALKCTHNLKSLHADYSPMNWLDSVMVQCFCPSARGVNNSTPSTPWYSEDALIALSAAQIIKSPWLSLHVTDSTFLKWPHSCRLQQSHGGKQREGLPVQPLALLWPSITAVTAAVLSLFAGNSHRSSTSSRAVMNTPAWAQEFLIRIYPIDRKHHGEREQQVYRVF